MRKIATSLLTLLLLTTTVALPVSAKPKGNWSDLKNLTTRQMLAIKTKDGVTMFGVFVAADDSGISVYLAENEGISFQETSFQRDQIEKVWKAKLRFGERSRGKGALIGLGIGVGVALVASLIQALRDSSDPPTGAGLYPIVGAGVGAAIGTKKGHKKGKLIYSV